jgi:glutamate-1-semialdehyde 2,1-aminomutase
MNVAAGIATLNKLASPQHGVYEHVRSLGQFYEESMKEMLVDFDQAYYLGREGSAFCLYFMNHAPRDYHDLAANHNFALDKNYRRRLIELGIFNFPLPVKQGSISFAHTRKDIEETLEKTEKVLCEILKRKKAAVAAIK